MKARSEGPHTSPDVHRDGARANAREMSRCSHQWCWLRRGWEEKVLLCTEPRFQLHLQLCSGLVLDVLFYYQGMLWYQHKQFMKCKTSATRGGGDHKTVKEKTREDQKILVIYMTEEKIIGLDAVFWRASELDTTSASSTKYLLTSSQAAKL